MQNLALKIILIVVLLGLFTWSIVAKQLRLGKDLQGGVSLVYQVSIPDTATDPEGLVDRVIDVLKDRVNPTGVLDISFQRVGSDRIEIVMPLPDEDVRVLSDAYKDELRDVVAKAVIRPTEIDEAIDLGADEVAARFGADTTTIRGQRAESLENAVAARATARAELRAAEDEEGDDARLNRLRQTLADTEIDVEDARDELLRTSLGETRVLRVLRLPTDPQFADDPETGERVERTSQRFDALSRLKTEFGHVSTDLDGLVEAFDVYQSKRKGFDDPEDLMRLLRGAGVLEFRISVRYSQPEGLNVTQMVGDLNERGPDNVDSTMARWFPLENLKQWYETPEELASIEANPESFFQLRRDLVVSTFDERHYMLLYNTPTRAMTHETDDWGIQQTYRSVDQLGRPAVAFNLDAGGGRIMSRLTGENIREPMAIVLDGKVYSAPTIQGQIAGNGIITGNFSQEELNYLIRVLAAGALSAQLDPEPIAMNTLGPSIGADNLRAGLEAFIVALIAVAIFMLCYYFFAGLVADFALLANGLIIFGMMMGLDATFTLPGLAGIVLTIGMAVDANVLIYERIREEIFAGELDLRGAIREGYAKALSTIIDANVTNLIVCFVLFRTATTEVKGFAVTLSIGICATLFTALFVTRQVYYLYTDVFGSKRLQMLPTLFPAIHRALEPSINWIGLRHIFWTISVIAVIGSGALVWSQGAAMFDTEFRGGVAAEIKTKDGLLLRQLDVTERVQAIGSVDPASATDETERTRLRILREFQDAAVLTVGDIVLDEQGLVTAERFQIKVANPKQIADDRAITPVVVEAISREFGEQLDMVQRLEFDGDTATDHAPYTYPIELPGIRDVLQRTDIPNHDLSEFLGGVLVIANDIRPPADLEDVRRRIDEMARQPDFEGFPIQDWQVLGLRLVDPDDPASGYHEIAVAVTGPVSYLVDDITLVDERLANPSWRLIWAALQRQTSLERVASFSSSVARTLSANALVAVVLSLLGILVYIWVRFGSLRYSLAAIVALVHDVTIALGLLAITGIIGGTAFASSILIEPFRIDLGVVAALLTIIGYSLNDTIVILDRIRENRGKRPIPTAAIVNRSINQTVSRTILTSVTTLIAVLIMYAFGGTGIRPFTFCLLIGILVGTYSSVAIAAPLVYKHGTEKGGDGLEGVEGLKG